MIFFFGESLRSKANPIGEKPCPVCQCDRLFTEQKETTWFSVFMIPVLPIEESACFWRCENCKQAFVPGDLNAPSQVPMAKRVIVYLLAGYGHDNALAANEICQKVLGVVLEAEEYREISRQIHQSDIDLQELIRRHATYMDVAGKQKVIEAAFLTTYVCCDLEYEDRVRINLMGNAMGVALEFVEYCIEQVRHQRYYGVQRIAVSRAV